MGRRTFIAAVGAGLLAAPLAVEAQPAGKVYRVALIFTTSPVSEMVGPAPIHPAARAFVQGLRELGYVEGQNLILEPRSGEGRFERFGDIVAELVRLKTDVIVVSNDAIVRAAKAVTRTVPIVMISGDPVAAGLVQSLARPGGNITGLAVIAGAEVEAKRLDLLREAVRGLSRVAYLVDKQGNEWDSPYGRSVRTAANALGVTLLRVEYVPAASDEAFDLIRRARPEALFIGGANAPAFANRARLAEFAMEARLPSSAGYRAAVEVGALMSYGADTRAIFRRSAGYVDKILKGAKPADLPIEQPTKFELVINLRTAKALGLTIPPSLLLRADQVIE